MTNPVNPFPYATQSGTINNVATSVVVDSSAKFPQAGTFTVAMDSEIITGCSVTDATHIALGTRGASGGGAAASHTSAVVYFVGNLSVPFLDTQTVGPSRVWTPVWAGPECFQPSNAAGGTTSTYTPGQSYQKRTFMFKNTTDQSITITLAPTWDYVAGASTPEALGYQLNTVTGGGATYQVVLAAGNVTPQYGILTLGDLYDYVAVNAKAGAPVTTGLLFCRMIASGPGR